MSRMHLSGPARLDGQVALITGAAGGMGRSITKTLIEAGATIIATDLAETNPLPTHQSLHYHRYDVTSRKETDDVIDTCIKIHGAIDIAILCAGIIAKTPLATSTDDEWDRLYSVNVKGVVNPLRKLYPLMVERGYGKIVAAGSIAAKNGGIASGPAYVAAKSAVHGIIRWIAKTGAPHGVYANTIAPGPVETPMWASVKDNAPPSSAANVPLGRFGTPDDIAQAVLFLCSPASNWITGTSLDVSGGMWMS